VLNEYGEDLNDYIFLNDLDFALSFYTYGDDVEQEADFDAKLDEYLADVSAERGFTVTRNEISSYLTEYSYSFDDFETVSDLKDYLGEVIKADHSNLDYFKTNYGMDEKALLDLVEKNGSNIDDYIYMDQLEELIWSSEDGSDSGENLADYLDILNRIGLTEAELQNLENHFLTNSDYLSTPEVQSHIEELGRQMMALAETFIEKGTADENYRPSDAQISEFASLYEDLLSAAKLKVVFSIVKDGVETQYSIEELMNIDTFENADFKVAIYNDASELLADAVITSDFVKSELGQVIEEANNAVGTETGSAPVKTVKGGTLPKTAANYIAKVILGLFSIMAGILTFRKIRTEKNEISGKQI
jgi:processed acidic surface protein